LVGRPRAEEIDMSTTRSHVLVLGGTGILRPAADALTQLGWLVTAVGTGARPAGAGQRLLSLDARDVPALAAALDDDVREGGRYAAAIVYAPVTGWPALEAVAAHTDGTLVDVLTSGVAAPDADAAPVARRAEVPGPASVRQLLLGWTEQPPIRFHTPQEVSDGALALLQQDGSARATLGVVRPWSDRPLPGSAATA
jgi:hypothetical protein